MKAITSKEITKKWKLGESIDWRILKDNEKREWLLACLFATGLPKGTMAIKNYTIDGGQVKNSIDLYCLLGEVFFGDKGYFGQDLDGLDDCFADIIILPGTKLTIKNHERLASTVNKEITTYFTMLTDIFKR